MIFRCAKCKIPICKDVAFANESVLTGYVEGMHEEDYLLQGFYSIGVPTRTEPEIYPRTDEHYVFNVEDLTNTKHHSDGSRLGGCCGLSGMSGLNTVCINDHEIGIECSDCWMAFHYVHIPPENIEPVES